MTHSSTDLRFLGDWAVWAVLATALLLAGAAWWLYRRETRAQPGRAAGVLPWLRAAAVFFIVLMLAGPVLHHRRVIGELARVMVFVDSSKSMSVTDEFMDAARKVRVARAYHLLDGDAAKTNQPVTAETLSNETVRAAIQKFDSLPRWQRLETLLLDKRDGLLPQFAKKHNVELWALAGEEPQRLWNAEQAVPLPTTLTVKPEGEGTDLATAIAARVGQRRDERCVVVVLSDGQHNLGGSPIETAKVAANRNIPMFTVGVGALERPSDLAIVGVTAPESVFFEDRVRGEITLKDDMAPGQSFVMRIEDDGETLWEKTLTTERNHRRKVEFDFPIKELVEARRKDTAGAEYTSLPLSLKVNITPLDGEKDQANNQSPLRVRAVTQRRKLLLLDGRPRWEFRYLRNMFERDPKWEVNALVAGTEITDSWPRGNGPGKFPTEKEALFAYDLIGFGEVPRKLLTEAELGWIREFVGTRGGGIFFVDGQRDVLRGYAGTPLGTLFPIEWLGKGGRELPANLQLTDRGAEFGPLRLASDPAENASLWRNLQPPHWVTHAKALPGAETLVEAMVGAQKLPVVVTRRFGAGKVLYMGLDESWRWRYNVADQWQEPFWHQMANAIMEPPYAVRDKHLALDVGAVNYHAGDAAEIRVRLSDEQGRVVSRGSPVAVLYRDGEKISTLSLSADENEGGLFRGKTSPLTHGRYEVAVDARGAVPETSLPRVEFHVVGKGGDTSREMGELSCNEELLQQMARASAGEYYREEDAARLVEKLEPLSKGRVEESETILWQSWWWFVPVIGLLTVEWILRKRVGLI